MGARSKHSADSRGGAPSQPSVLCNRWIRLQVVSPTARISQHFRPGLVEDFIRDQQVPILNPPTALALAAYNVVRLAGTQASQWIQVGSVGHQGFLVLFQKEPHLCSGGCILQQENVLDDLVEIEELNRFQGPPYLFPTSGQVRPVQHVDKGSFQVGYHDSYSGTSVAGDAKHLLTFHSEGMRNGSPSEFMRLKLQRERFARGHVT